MTRPRRTFTPEYKAEVVALVQEGGKSPHRVAKDLGLTSSAVAGWVQQARIDAGAGGSADLTTEERHELGRLRKENRELRTEREILKKATAFFAKHCQ